MSLKQLPKLNAERIPEVCAFEPDPDTLDKWDSGVRAVQSGANTISVLDVIGDDLSGGVTSRRIAAALRSIRETEVFVDINSPGGDFFEGVAIYNMLREHKAKVTVRILGIAASAASVIAMAGDEIQIGKAGFLMVHNAWVMAVGNRHDLIEAAATMEPFDDAMATLYADRAGIEKAKASEWMDRETWFNGEQAVSVGLADAYLSEDSIEIDAKIDDPIRAVRQVDTILAKSGVSRSERRRLIAELKGGTQDAAATATHDAGEVTAGLNRLIETLKL